MKRTFKSLCLTLALLTLLCTFLSCSAREKSKKDTGKISAEVEEKDDVKSEEKKEELPEIKNGVTPFEMEEIAWEAKEAVVNGKRTLVFRYTNNTKVTILSLEVEFRAKEGITAEEKEDVYQFLISDHYLDEEDSAELRTKDFVMNGDSKILVKPGKKSPDENLCFFNGYYSVEKKAHADLFEPDIATIAYVYDGRIYIAYYDFIGECFSLDEESEVAFYWTTSDLGKKIPKPNTEVVMEYFYDEADEFQFMAWGITEKNFETYREDCVKKGFDQVIEKRKGSYEATNADGYLLEINYYDYNETMVVSISIPETDE